MSFATLTSCPEWSSRSRPRSPRARDLGRAAAIIAATMVRYAGNDVGPSDDNEDVVVDPAMLAEALTKARRLVAEMEKQQAEVEAAPPNLPPQQLAMGKLA